MTKEEYEVIKERLNKGSKAMKGHWFDNDPKYKKWGEEYERLGVLALEYEIENNLLPI